MVLHFPDEIYKSTGVAEIAPQLLRVLDPGKVRALQFLRNSRVPATLKSTAYRDELLWGSSFLHCDVAVPVTAADGVFHPVYVRDLPFEVPDADVISVFQALGVVKSTRPFLP